MSDERVFLVNAAGDLTLLASRDIKTGLGVFPRLPATSPAAIRYNDLDLEGPAKLYSYTVIHPNPKTGQMPFVLAMVDYPQKARVMALLDCPNDALSIGMLVEASHNATAALGFIFIPARESKHVA